MPKMIQIRNVPDDLHRRLKSKAARAGMSLSDFLLREARLVADRPSLEEMLERLNSRPPVDLSIDAAEAVRAERDAR